MFEVIRDLRDCFFLEPINCGEPIDFNTVSHDDAMKILSEKYGISI